MICERSHRTAAALASTTMMRSPSPALRPASPANSEISVGSPSPPPPPHPLFGARIEPLHPATAFHPLHIKRQRLGHPFGGPELPSAADAQGSIVLPLPLTVPPTRRRSCAERVKSFSIADILGKRDDDDDADDHKKVDCEEPEPDPEPTPATVAPMPRTHSSTLLPPQMLTDRLPPPLAPPPPALGPPPSQLLLDAMVPANSVAAAANATVVAAAALATKVAHPWDAARGAPLPLRPFFPPALFHYEQRMAWDYQRQLQEHFHVQAQLLRQMSLDPGIIPSEDGSERSRSSSTASDCCSPEAGATANGYSGMDLRRDDRHCSDMDDGEHRKDTTTANANAATAAATANKSSADGKRKATEPGDTPLDALFQLSTKNFDEEQDPTALSIFAARPNPKKKRKSRTAFTNHQIFELEKRFLYQKYLSPADRDEIAAGLGLSNAQVITWFQNRRAKLKRDMEELKKDVESVKQLSAHKSFLENVNDFSILKTRPVSRHQPPPQAQPQPQQQQPQIQPSNIPARIPATAAPTHGNHSPAHVAADIEGSGNDGSPDQGSSPTFETARFQSNNSRG